MKNKMKNNFLFFSVLVGLFLWHNAQAGSASLFLSPGSKSFSVNDSFSVQVKVNPAGTSINAAQATIYFPAEKIQVMDIIIDDSVFSIWAKEPEFSNLMGKVSFAGGLPQPGTSQTGNIITINFKAMAEGEVSLFFDSALVLANDGQGTNILTYLQPAKYTVFQQIRLPELVSSILSLTHPKQSDWYINNNPDFYWKTLPETTGISFILDHYQDTVPDMVPESYVQSKKYENLDDGVWYFHLRLADSAGWGEVSHYKIQIDTLPPDPFEIVVDNAGDPTNPQPNLYFETEDKVSGLSYYKIKVGDEMFSILTLAQVNPFSLKFDNPGEYPIVVRAVDGAGNNVETNTVLDIEPIKSPEITLWPEFHVSGEELFYVSGISLPNNEIMVFLKKEGKLVKTWLVRSNEQGEWSVTSDELMTSGVYEISTQAKDDRGAQSLVSAQKEIIVSFSGVALGSWLISFQSLVLLFTAVLLAGIIAIGFLMLRTSQRQKKLRKESAEAKSAVDIAFADLKEEIGEKIRLFDSQPEFSEKEKKVYEELKKSLDKAEKFIEKEINDVEKELD
ncbi:MAG: cohesin domain-containing protein [Candidatus Nealsonbacteria bacterium]